MSAPIAGRRKGLNSASSPSAAPLVPVGGDVGFPSWLSNADDGVTAAAPSGTVQGSTKRLDSFPPSVDVPFFVAVDNPSVGGSPVKTATVLRGTDHDPLAFLNEIEAPASPAGLRSASGHPPSVGNSAPKARSSEWSRPAVTTGEPIAGPSSTPVPAFLRDDNEGAFSRGSVVPMGSGVLSDHTGTATVASPPTLGDPSQMVESQQAQRAALGQQLIDLECQLTEGMQRVEELERGLHPLAVEVSVLENTLVSLRAMEASAHDEKKEKEAQAQREAVSDATLKDIDEEMHAYRRECVQRHQQKIEDLSQALHAQQSQNATFRAELEAAVTRDASDEPQASVLDPLLLGIQERVRRLKRKFALQCKEAVAQSARVYLSAARQQRAEIFANDGEVRAKTMAKHRARCEAEASAFQEKCHRTFQERADTAFGRLKIAAEAAHRQHLTECNQRVAAFQSRLASMTERSRSALEQQASQRLERESAIAIAQRDAAAKEFAARQEEMSARLQVYRSHAEAEVRALRDSHHEQRPFNWPPSLVPVSSAPTREVAHRELDLVRSRMEQVVLLFRSRREHESSLLSAGEITHSVNCYQASGACGTGDSKVSSWASLGHLNEGWQRSLSFLQQSREALRRSIADVKDAVRGWASKLQHGRMQVVQQREVVKAIRAEWDQTIRRQLSRCLTAAGSSVPASESLTTSLLLSVNQHVSDMLSAQQSLRAARLTFVEQFCMRSQCAVKYRTETERLLADIFQKMDLVREQSIQEKLDQLALQSLHAQVDSLDHHIMEVSNTVALRKQHIFTALKNPHLASSLLPPQKN